MKVHRLFNPHGPRLSMARGGVPHVHGRAWDTRARDSVHLTDEKRLLTDDFYHAAQRRAAQRSLPYTIAGLMLRFETPRALSDRKETGVTRASDSKPLQKEKVPIKGTPQP